MGPFTNINTPRECHIILFAYSHLSGMVLGQNLYNSVGLEREGWTRGYCMRQTRFILLYTCIFISFNLYLTNMRLVSQFCHF